MKPRNVFLIGLCLEYIEYGLLRLHIMCRGQNMSYFRTFFKIKTCHMKVKTWHIRVKTCYRKVKHVIER